MRRRASEATLSRTARPGLSHGPRRPFIQYARVFLASLLLTACAPALAQSSGFVTTRGKQFVAPDGRPLFLKGINLGNWLLPEGYMFKFKTASSPRLIHTVINQLVGEEEAKKFWRAYRDQYIALDDIRFIKRAGFNSVRVPFNYRLFVTDGDPQRLEGVGYELLDRVVNWRRRKGSTSSWTCTARLAGRRATT